MESLSRQRIIIYSVAGILAVVLLGIIVYSQISLDDAGLEAVIPPPASVAGITSTEAQQPFRTEVLSTPLYHTLDRSLFDAKRLPVPPPASRGKPNLFGL